MTEQELIRQLKLGLLKVYGLQEGIGTAEVVVPGILRDFRSMLERAGADETVEEAYRTEDRKAEIVLRGRKDKNGRVHLEEGTVRVMKNI